MTKHIKENDRLRKIVESFPKLTVTVLADLVADEFVFGEISRVSREAPVLILKHRDRKTVPGGGANAICNLADLGVNVLPVGVRAASLTLALLDAVAVEPPASLIATLTALAPSSAYLCDPLTV